MKTIHLWRVTATMAILAIASFEARASKPLVNAAIMPTQVGTQTGWVITSPKPQSTATALATVANKTSGAGATNYTVSPDIIPILPKTNYVFPPVGNLDLVMSYAVKSVDFMVVFAGMYNTNGVLTQISSSIRYSRGTNAMTSKAQMDQLIAAGINTTLNYACTNTSGSWVKSKGVLLNIYCFMYSDTGSVSQDLFYYYKMVQLILNPDGTYSYPSLPGFSMNLEAWVPFAVPGLVWARTEIGNKGNPVPFEIDDDNYAAGSTPMGPGGFLYIPTGYLTNSSSSTGNLWIKTSMFDGTNVFQLFNGDGNPIPETPFRLAIKNVDGYASVTVCGGDPGRGYTILSSSDMVKWTGSEATYFVSPLPEGQATPPQYPFQSVANGAMFFRTMCVNAPPTD